MRFVGRCVLTVAGAVQVGLLVTGCASGQDGTGAASGAAPSTSQPPTKGGHQHRMHEVSGGEAPSVRLEVKPDADSGWNVHLVTANFRFAPENAGGRVRAGEGHAHLYLDGVKIARVYGPWHHLPGKVVPAGDHVLKAELNANDHGAWAVGGEPVAATTTLTGPKAADVTVKVALSGGKASPEARRVEVREGRWVRLQVSADRPDTVHVHGYDLERPVAPGKPAVIEFTADRTGVFEVETHHDGVLLARLEVR